MTTNAAQELLSGVLSRLIAMDKGCPEEIYLLIGNYGLNALLNVVLKLKTELEKGFVDRRIYAQGNIQAVVGGLGTLVVGVVILMAANALAIAVLSLALGGTFSFVLIQEKLAGLLSDTFFVPAYFHFLTVGTVSLTLYTPGATGPELCGGAASVKENGLPQLRVKSKLC